MLTKVLLMHTSHGSPCDTELLLKKVREPVGTWGQQEREDSEEHFPLYDLQFMHGNLNFDTQGVTGEACPVPSLPTFRR